MPRKQNIKRTQPHLVSSRISDGLYKKLEAKAIELGIENISETIRFLLGSVLENPPIDKTLQYVILSHLMIRESILSLVDDGDKLINKAEIKAKKLIEDLKKA